MLIYKEISPSSILIQSLLNRDSEGSGDYKKEPQFSERLIQIQLYQFWCATRAENHWVWDAFWDFIKQALLASWNQRFHDLIPT